MALQFSNPDLGNFVDQEVLDKTYSVNEVLEQMPGLQRQTLYNMVKRGALRAEKNGRHIRIYKDNFTVVPDAPATVTPEVTKSTKSTKTKKSKKSKKS